MAAAAAGALGMGRGGGGAERGGGGAERGGAGRLGAGGRVEGGACPTPKRVSFAAVGDMPERSRGTRAGGGTEASTVGAVARGDRLGSGREDGLRWKGLRSSGMPDKVESRRSPRGLVGRSPSPIAWAAAKNVRSSAMSPRGLKLSPERLSSSLGSRLPSVMRRCSSFRDPRSTSLPSRRRTRQTRSAVGPAPGRNTLKRCPQFVHLTVVPRAETKVSSNSYSVPQRSQVTSMSLEISARVPDRGGPVEDSEPFAADR